MGLADFIAAHIEVIASEYEAFARTLTPAAAKMDSNTLRDHAAQMLRTFVVDMRRPQTENQQAEKSKGRAVRVSPALTAAEEHGAQRAGLGFYVHQAVAEYRALRASVVRLWLASGPALGADEIEELIRFNEGVDQALAESVLYFAMAAANDRTMFMGVLSHELRTPLGTIVASAHAMRKAADLDRVLPDAVDRTLRSAGRIENILNDMLDFVRSETRGGIRVRPSPMDMDVLCERVVHDARSTFADRTLELTLSGHARGVWDENRITQALTNLINNAMKYGDHDKPVRVSVSNDARDEVVVTVQNEGPVISPEQLNLFFQPLVRGTDKDKTGSSLGLGLFIVKEIALAHGGSVRALSTPAEGTRFSIVLPVSFAGARDSAFGSLGVH
ncbi:sensor histidine kinase [Piscinibacter terrae]|uniref:histidine kinase n=1 Tax=Piscinibacter terrae TaxID=2496871 RepID=A0A3N7HKS9_9BURK|nr:HAMP domain-containing sensor histidine kinase [Albitalea terrae]RQP22700.1 sensor histidine kinase [Albitalea terrae]